MSACAIAKNRFWASFELFASRSISLSGGGATVGTGRGVAELKGVAVACASATGPAFPGWGTGVPLAARGASLGVRSAGVSRHFESIKLIQPIDKIAAPALSIFVLE